MKASTKIKKELSQLQSDLLDFQTTCKSQFDKCPTFEESGRTKLPQAYYLGDRFFISDFNRRIKEMKVEIERTESLLNVVLKAEAEAKKNKSALTVIDDNETSELAARLQVKGITRISAETENEALITFTKVKNELSFLKHKGEAINLIHDLREKIFIIELEAAPFLRNFEKLILSNQY